MSIRSIYILVLLIIPILSFGQNSDASYQKEISMVIIDEPLIEVLYNIEKISNVTFMFDQRNLPYFLSNKSYEKTSILTIIKELTNGSLIEPIVYDEKTIIFVPINEKSREEILRIKDQWEAGILKYPVADEVKEVSIINKDGAANNSPALNLNLVDFDSNESIIGALVFNRDTSQKNISDFEGNVSFNLRQNKDVFFVQSLGYQDVKILLDINATTSQTIAMERASLNLSEIKITAKSSKERIQNTKIGVTSLSTTQLESIPQVTGEKDLLKSLEILPGVTTSGELSGGINVRGGRIDESLILFNDAIIFNPTHVVGFISGFNADIIESADLYKGYVSPEYGNRSSAVLEMNGSYGSEKRQIKAGIGTSQLKGSMEGPIGKKATYALSARGSFSDYILNATGIPELKRSSANFYDLYGAVSYKINPRHSLNFSTYYSNDEFIYNEQYGFDWNNSFINLAYKANWTKNIFSTISLTRGGYSNNQTTFDTGRSYIYSNAITYTKATAKINRYFFGESYITGGVEAINYENAPESIEPFLEGSIVVKNETPRNGSMSVAPFLFGKAHINAFIQVEGGIRYANYLATGNHSVYEYESEFPTKETISSVTEIPAGEQFYRNAVWEPRASLNLQLIDRLSVKLGYGILSQNAQLIRLANTSIPTDLWVFSNQYIKPRIVSQYSGGVFYLNKKENLNSSFSVFRKTTSSFFILKDFPVIVSNPHLETELLNADQQAYGFEFQLEYNTPKWNLFTAYSYSKTQFQSQNQRAIINRGEWYNGDIDIPHQANILTTYKLVPAIKLNAAMTYKSGRPVTAPIGSAPIDGILIPLFGDRNEFRIPSYFRLDLAANLDLRKLKKDGLRSNFTVGLYNATGNRNAFNVFFRTGSDGNIESYKFSVIGRAIPSISWNIIID